MANYEKAYPKTAISEGGWANVLGDRGGPTYAGITQNNFPKLELWKLLKKYQPLRHNQRVKDEEIEAQIKKFYKDVFWDAIKGDEIEDQLTAERLYDFGITAGQPRSIRQIQEILGIPQTGRVDAKTIEAINDPAKFLST